jgi:hypothetical protein
MKLARVDLCVSKCIYDTRLLNKAEYRLSNTAAFKISISYNKLFEMYFNVRENDSLLILEVKCRWTCFLTGVRCFLSDQNRSSNYREISNKPTWSEWLCARLSHVTWYSHPDKYFSPSTWAQDHKTKAGDRTQISSIWLAEMATKSPVQPIWCLTFKTNVHSQFYNLGHKFLSHLLQRRLQYNDGYIHFLPKRNAYLPVTDLKCTIKSNLDYCDTMAT